MSQTRIRKLQAEYRKIHDEVLDAGRRGTLEGVRLRHLQSREEKVVRELHRLGAEPYARGDRA